MAVQAVIEGAAKVAEKVGQAAVEAGKEAAKVGEKAVKAGEKTVKAGEKVAETGKKTVEAGKNATETAEKTGEVTEGISDDIDETAKTEKRVLEPNTQQIKGRSLESIEAEATDKTIEEVAKPIEEDKLEEVAKAIEEDNVPEGLTAEQKEQILKETGWSSEIIDHIESMEQYEIYKSSNLHEAVVDGKTCLVKDIDWDYVDPKTGLTNRERVAKKLSPIDATTGEKIELHHMNQEADAPFAELCEDCEHGDGNHSTLHPKSEGSWRLNPELNKKYNAEKKRHWEERAKEV